MTTKAELLKRFQAHAKEAADLKSAMEEAGVTRKDLNALARTQAKAAKLTAQLAEELGEEGDDD